MTRRRVVLGALLLLAVAAVVLRLAPVPHEARAVGGWLAAAAGVAALGLAVRRELRG